MPKQTPTIKPIATKIRIKRTFTLTSTKGSREDIDIVRRYFEHTILDIKGLRAFANTFDVNVVDTTPNGKENANQS